MQRIRLSIGILLCALPLTAGAECMGPYPPSMVKAFNQGCSKDPQMQSYCGCIMDKVQKTIPLAEFIEIGNTTGIDTDPRFTKASKECLAQPAGGSATPAPAAATR